MSKWEIARDAIIGMGFIILLLSILGWLSRL